MTTTWHDRPGDIDLQSREFLLTDGSVVKAPAFEESGSGLKTRVKGRPETSTYTRDFNTLLKACLEEVGKKRGATLWMPVDIGDKALEAQAQVDLGGPPATMSLVNDGFSSKVWWLFRHPSMPVSALLLIQLRGRRMEVSIATQQQSGSQTFNFITPQYATRASDFRPQQYFGHRTDYDERVQQLAREQPNETCHVLKQSISDLSPRPMAKHFFQTCQRIENMTEAQIPDMRDAEAKWLSLEFADTNLTPQLLAEVQEFLNDETGVGSVVEAYDHFRSTLAAAGMVLPSRDEDDFAQILQGGKKGLTLDMVATLNGEETDPEHLVHINVTTGAVVVTCDHDRDTTAYAWEESKLRAELTGEADALLAYARASMKTKHDARVQQTAKNSK